MTTASASLIANWKSIGTFFEMSKPKITQADDLDNDLDNLENVNKYFCFSQDEVLSKDCSEYSRFAGR